MGVFDNLALGRKFAVIGLVALAIVLLTAGALGWQAKRQMVEDRVRELHAVVDGAVSLAERLQTQVAAGTLTRAQALEHFVAEVGSLRYDHGNGYLFVNTMDGVVLANINKAIIGTNQIDAQTSGLPLTRLQRDGVRANGEMVMRYQYMRPDTGVLAPKITYVRAFPAWDIFLGSGAYIDDIDAQFAATARRAGLVALAGTMALSGLGWAVTRRVTRPLRALELRMTTLATGDLAAAIPHERRRDEVGRMARAVQVFRANALRVRQLEQENAAQRAQAEADHAARLAELMGGFEVLVGAVVQEVRHAAAEMRDAAGTLNATAAETTKESAASADASEHASGKVQAVASAAEQLSASVDEMTRRVHEAAAIAAAAVAEIGRTDAAVRGLADSAQRIGDVVALIRAIATQTSLLALNASIEASRAGAAGRGFAVVAGEVKALAGQTARATDQIRAQIDAMQSATGATVAAVRGVGGTVGRISAIAAALDEAMAQQGAATREIAANVTQVAQGTQAISASTGRVRSLAGRTGAEAGRVLSTADVVATEAERLYAQVEGFLAAMRAA